MPSIRIFGYYILLKKVKKYCPKVDGPRQKRLQQKRRKDGLCQVCRVRIEEINKSTKRLYAKCRTCRDHENALCKKRRKLK